MQAHKQRGGSHEIQSAAISAELRRSYLHPNGCIRRKKAKKGKRRKRKRNAKGNTNNVIIGTGCCCCAAAAARAALRADLRAETGYSPSVICRRDVAGYQSEINFRQYIRRPLDLSRPISVASWRDRVARGEITRDGISRSRSSRQRAPRAP